MDDYDRLYEVYDRFDTEELRAYREFVDLFPPLSSPVALDRWDEATARLAERRSEIVAAFDDGERLAEIAARADRTTAFTALDLRGKYGRAVNALVLDVDETLRSAGDTDNEIPRETLHLLTEFVERGVPLVICTGQTLENVKGFLVQGLGNELVHSGDVSVVYEAGAGVFTPGHGADTKRLLYDDLPEDSRGVVDDVRSRVLRAAPESIRRGCHLQGNEFNVTLKPNHETGGPDAAAVIDEGVVHLLDLVGEAVADRVAVGEVETTAPPASEAAVRATHYDGDAADGEDDESLDDPAPGAAVARAFFADADPEVAGALAREGGAVAAAVPDAAADLLGRLDVALYYADAAELAVRALDKAQGVAAALDVLGIDDPFVAVVGDSKSDLRAMEWAADRDAGIAAAPAHASERVLEHVRATDELVFPPGEAATLLRTIWALNCLVDDEFEAAGADRRTREE
ncbi:HAD family hydrolase [Halobaculum sp. MBLA0147]|uniref:HAD family hydrolase n=1 Tax=Halobaculum sp. MBLA0147 TaxID=3079934 RepID=UPI003526423D